MTSIDRSSYSFLELTLHDDGVLLARMTRPETLNSTDHDEGMEFNRILREAAADDDVRVLVLAGEGRAFSAGSDFGWLEECHRRPELMDSVRREASDLIDAHLVLEKPVVTALNGYAAGNGAVFALLSDFIIAEESAKFGDGHIRAALVAGDGGVLIWPLAVGLIRAKQYLMTGDWIEAREACRIGLVTEVVADGTSLERALALGHRLAAGPQFAIRSTKRALNAWYRRGLPDVQELALALQIQSIGTPDVGAAVEDFRAGGAGTMGRWSWASAWDDGP